MLSAHWLKNNSLVVTKPNVRDYVITRLILSLCRLKTQDKPNLKFPNHDHKTFVLYYVSECESCKSTGDFLPEN